MARYFFDLTDGAHTLIDEEGTELDSLKDAESEAATALADIARDALRSQDFSKLGIAVRNETGEVVLTMSVKFDIQKSASATV